MTPVLGSKGHNRCPCAETDTAVRCLRLHSCPMHHCRFREAGARQAAEDRICIRNKQPNSGSGYTNSDPATTLSLDSESGLLNFVAYGCIGVPLRFSPAKTYNAVIESVCNDQATA